MTSSSEAVKIDCLDLEQDASDLHDFLRAEGFSEIRMRVRIQESLHSQDRILALIVQYGPYVAGAVGMKVLDLVGHAVERWFEKEIECKHRTINIYGPNNEVVKKVECQRKHN